ncbi:unnamed protein product [Sphagnum balticum]
MSYPRPVGRINEGEPLISSSTSRVVSGYSQAGGNNLNQTTLVESRLDYENSHGQDILISGYSDFGNLRNLKNALLSLQGNFLQEGNHFILSGDQKEEFNKRLFLLEGEIDGLLKRRINVSSGDSTGRVLDYSLLINEKENQVVELEKKIQNFEEKLRRASKREG